MKAMLSDAPELESRTLFDFFNERALRATGEEKYGDGQLRTLQRRLKKWRASERPTKTVFFAQEHTPGEAFQTDFTDANELEITVQGVVFRHKLGNTCLPYSTTPSVIAMGTITVNRRRVGIKIRKNERSSLPERPTYLSYRGDLFVETVRFGLQLDSTGVALRNPGLRHARCQSSRHEYNRRCSGRSGVDRQRLG